MSGNRWSVVVRELNIFFWLDGKQNRILCTRQRCDGHEIIPPRERSGVAGARRFNIGKKTERGGATIGWSFHHFRDDQWETSYKLLDTLCLYYFPPMKRHGNRTPRLPALHLFVRVNVDSLFSLQYQHWQYPKIESVKWEKVQDRVESFKFSARSKRRRASPAECGTL